MNSIKLKYVTVLMIFIAGTYSLTSFAQQTAVSPAQAPGSVATPVESTVKVQIADEARLAQPPVAADPQTANQTVSFDDWVTNFEKEFETSISRPAGGKTFYAAQIPIRVPPTDTTYVKNLSVAYSEAILKLQADYVLSLYGELRVDAVKKFFNDDSTNARLFPDIDKELAKISTGSMAQENRIINKALKALEGSIDQKLVEQGVDAAKVKQLTIPQKKVLLINNISLPSFKTAFGSVSGLVPVRTRLFTVIDSTTKKPAVMLGVIATISGKTQQFALDLSRLNPSSNVKGKPHPLSFYIPQNGEDRMNMIGLRYGYDEQGRPMLISFGQWSVYQKTDDPALALTLQQAAERTAQSNAESYIAFFAQTSLKAKSNQTIDAMQENALKKINKVDATTGELIESPVNPDPIKELLDIKMESVDASAKIAMRGMAPYKGWTEVGADGLTRIGKIVIWSYADLENQNKMSRPPSSRSENGSFAPQSGESKLVNTKDDF